MGTRTRKGDAAPPGAGRPKGSRNKTTVEFKEAVNRLLTHATPKMIGWLEEIDDPTKRFDVIAKLAEYAFPKLARSEVVAEVEATVQHSLPQEDKDIINRFLAQQKEPK